MSGAEIPRILIIAGSDSGGGAGIQADIKTVTVLGGYAMTAVTAVTVQNTLGVTNVHAIPEMIVGAQIDAVLSDIGADAVKTGMLGSAAAIAAIAGRLTPLKGRVPIVVDPVMAAKGGAPLLAADAEGALVSRLLPLASLLTPNIPEAERLTGHAIVTIEDMIAAGCALRARGPEAVLVKGGHLEGEEVVDVLVAAEGVTRLSGRRIATRHTHGTGCTLASAIACHLGAGLPLAEAVGRARDYVQAAIAAAPGFGHGQGPLDHGHGLRPKG